jgi:mRNA-degrading endonuclease toxin of MazEF toxin-antitoxin module
MARILRGEIRWADLNPVRGREEAGLRPVVIPEDGFGSCLLGTARNPPPTVSPLRCQAAPAGRNRPCCR